MGQEPSRTFETPAESLALLLPALERSLLYLLFAFLAAAAS